MTDDPVGHKAAIGTAGNAHSICVDFGIPPQNLIRELHQIPEVYLSVLALKIGKGISLAAASSGVAVAYEKAGGRPKLHLMVEARAKYHLRPTVNMEDARIPLARLVAHRLHHEAVDIHAVRVEEIQRLAHHSLSRDGAGEAVGDHLGVDPAVIAAQIFLAIFVHHKECGVLVHAIVPHDQSQAERLPAQMPHIVDAVFVGRDQRLRLVPRCFSFKKFLISQGASFTGITEATDR